MLTFEERLALYPTDHDERVKELESNFEFYFNRWLPTRWKDPAKEYETLYDLVEFLSFIEYLHNEYGEQIYSNELSVPQWSAEDRLRIAAGEDIPDVPIKVYYTSKVLYTPADIKKKKARLAELESKL